MGDLQAINAALRLGDPAIPPVGAVLDLDGSVLWEVTRLVHTSRGCKVYLENTNGARMVETAAHILISGPWQGQVALLPADAPPFKDWERYHVQDNADR